MKLIKVYCQLLNISLENLVLTLKNPSYLPQIWLKAVIHHSEFWSALFYTCVYHCKAMIYTGVYHCNSPAMVERQAGYQSCCCPMDGKAEKATINPETRDVLRPCPVEVGNKQCNYVHLQAMSMTNIRKLKEREKRYFLCEIKSYCSRAQRGWA